MRLLLQVWSTGEGPPRRERGCLLLPALASCVFSNFYNKRVISTSTGKVIKVLSHRQGGFMCVRVRIRNFITF